MLRIFKGLFSLSSNVVTGIDAGAFSTKVISIRRRNDKREIVFLKEFPVMAYEKFEASLDRVAEDLSSSGVGKKGHLVLSVPLGNYSYFFLNIPKIPDEEIPPAIEWELKKHLPTPIEEYNFDYFIIREFSDETMRKYEVFVVAVKKNEIMKLLNIFKKKNLSIRTITVTPLALTGLTNLLPHPEKNETIIIGNIGFLKTEMVIIKDGVLRFARVVKLGISQVVANLNQNYGVPSDKSIILLKEKGFFNDSGHKDTLVLALNETLEKLSLEFQRFIDYFLAQYPGEECGKMYLVGGGAVIPGLVEAFQPFFDFKVDIFTPPSAVSVLNRNLTEELTTVFSAATGLALLEG